MLSLLLFSDDALRFQINDVVFNVVIVKADKSRDIQASVLMSIWKDGDSEYRVSKRVLIDDLNKFIGGLPPTLDLKNDLVKFK